MEQRKGDPKDKVEFDTELHGEVETDSTGKNTLIRDPDASIDTSELEILDYSPPQPDKPDENAFDDDTDPYNPYNSGIFKMSKAELAKAREWKTKRRK